MKEKYLTSEYVGIGHPDKVADQISDLVLDLYLEKDKDAHVAVETMVSGNKIILAGEIGSKAKIKNSILKKEIIELVDFIGYNPDISCDFRSDNLDINIYIKPQSENINTGVRKEDGDIGAGDQGIMFGYATNETSSFLPLPYVFASDLLLLLNQKIKNKEIEGIYTDNKSQVCCLYNRNKNPKINKIILSSFHSKKLSIKDVRKIINKEIIDPTLSLSRNFVDDKNDIDIFVNSAGGFWIGGPEADAGVTGRKIVVDTYGGFAPHGGGAFSGKDPSKVDRSATYMARHIAKNIVANGYAKEALVQLSYAIGHTEPFSINIKTEKGYRTEKQLIKLVNKNFDLSPKSIIDYLKLNDHKTIKYSNVASMGHFLNPQYPWEKIITLTL